MLVEMKEIVVDFGPVRAVDHVDFTVKPGEIIGLLGENGAGKTTLMNVLAGTFLPTGGSVCIDETPVLFHSALQAMKRGIRFIHQELSLCDDLTVAENMFLAEEVKKGPLLDQKNMARRAKEVFARMNVDIDPWAKVRGLQPAQQQLVEIGRALLFKSELIIMDEPTTALNTHEIENLFVIMRQLKAEGAFADIDEQQATELMIGRQLADDGFADKTYYGTEEIALAVDHISSAHFKDISFDLHRGEIIAITGLQGSGRDTLADALFGNAEYTGEVRVFDRPMRPQDGVIEHMKRGIGMVPRARKERGILNDLSIYDNLSMAYFNTRFKGPLISPQTENERFKREKVAMQIKTDHPKNPITSLSGGNQQKVILGRWLEADAEVLLFDNPTQGIDVGTKFEIYHLILRLAREGKAILVFSSEFPEIFKVADSCIVLYKGEIGARLSREEITEKNIMYYSTGANLEAANG